MKITLSKNFFLSIAVIAFSLMPVSVFAQNGSTTVNNGGVINDGGSLNNVDIYNNAYGGPYNIGGVNYSGGQYTGSHLNNGGLQNNGGLYNNTNFVSNVTHQNTAGLLNNPTTQSAGTCSNNFHTFGDVIYFFACMMNRYFVGILVTIATIYTIWGITQYITAPDSVEERTKSRQTIIWGIISMFVIVSVWGIIQLFRTTLGI